jgi:hypothetical protein
VSKEKEQLEKRPNLIWITNRLCVVRTQAGFRKSLKEFKNRDIGLWCGSEYPKSYPCVVEFKLDYVGYDRLITRCTPIKKYLERMQSQMDTIKGQLEKK